MLLTLGIQALLSLRRPAAVHWDANFSVYAAQNFVRKGTFKILQYSELVSNGESLDLASAHETWLTWWPPGLTLVYTSLFGCGFSAGSATKTLSFCSLLFGTTGWVLFLGSSASTLTKVILGFLIPWATFPLVTFETFFADQIIWAWTPWLFVLLRGAQEGGFAPCRVAAAGLFAGCLVVVKYSAFPILAASVLFGLYSIRSARVAGWVRVASLFLGSAMLPGALVYLTNKLLIGQATVILNSGFHLSGIGLQHLRNLFRGVLSESSGWAQLVPLNAGNQMATISVKICACVLGLVAALHIWKAWRSGAFHPQIVFLAIQTFVALGFLLGLTAILGEVYDFTSESRYYTPVIFGWFVLAGSLVGNVSEPARSRLLLGFLLCVPVMYGAARFIFLTAVHRPPARLPQSELRWINSSNEQAAFLARQVAALPTPDLVVTDDPSIIPELQLPTLVVTDRWTKKLRSSRRLAAWVLASSGSASRARNTFEGASSIEPIPVPNGFPLAFFKVQFGLDVNTR